MVGTGCGTRLQYLRTGNAAKSHLRGARRRAGHRRIAMCHRLSTSIGLQSLQSAGYGDATQVALDIQTCRQLVQLV